MKGSDIKPGDKVELANKGTSFFDPVTGLRLSIDGKAKLGDTIGKKTRTALLSGVLLLVEDQKPKNQGAPKTDATAAKPAPAKKAEAKEKK